MTETSSLSVKNMTIKYKIDSNIDLISLKDVFPDIRYDPSNFNGAILKRWNSCLLIFRNGKINVVGVASKEDGDHAICEFCESLRRLSGNKASVEASSVVNIVGCAKIFSHIRLDKLANCMKDCIFYNPDIFASGARYRTKTASGLIFTSGKMIITRVKSTDALLAELNSFKAKFNNKYFSNCTYQ